MALNFTSGSAYLEDTFEPIEDRLECYEEEEIDLRVSTDSMSEFQTLDEVGFHVTETGVLKLLSEDKREKVEAVWLKKKLPAGTIMSEPAEGECGICMTEYGDDFFETPCQHRYCRDCISYYFHLETGDVSKLNHVRSFLETDPETSRTRLRVLQVCGVLCPSPNCGTAIDAFEFRDAVSEETWNRFDAISLSASLEYLQMRGDVKPCPKKCGGFIQGCNTCSDPKCQKKTAQRREQTEFSLLRVWLRQHQVRRCPNCKALIEKNGGCDHMFCAHCKTRYNWSQSTLRVTGGQVKNQYN